MTTETENKNTQRGSFTAYYTGSDVSSITLALQNALFAKAHQSSQTVTNCSTSYYDDDKSIADPATNTTYKAKATAKAQQ